LRMCHLSSLGTDEPKKKAEQQPADDNTVITPLSSHEGQPADAVRIPPVTTAQKQKSVADAGTEKKISIRNLISEKKQKESTVNEPLPDTSSKPLLNEFTPEELTEAWNAFALKIKDESPRISVTLTAVTPELLPDKTIVLKLDNSALKEAFDHNFKARLEHHLKDTLHNSLLKLTTVVEATERGEILYSPEQKFNHLASKNPALRDLKKTFNLDFE
jgi:DNA polymerase-3 subunit gamma/tau